jgi:hypothetical protein
MRIDREKGLEFGAGLLIGVVGAQGFDTFRLAHDGARGVHIEATSYGDTPRDPNFRISPEDLREFVELCKMCMLQYLITISDIHNLVTQLEEYAIMFESMGYKNEV